MDLWYKEFEEKGTKAKFLDKKRLFVTYSDW